MNNDEAVKEIRRNAIKAGLKLVDCPIRHLGTENAHKLYYDIQKHLIANGVEILFDTTCCDLLFNGDVCVGAVFKPSKGGEQFTINADKVVVATGRKGADWLDDQCRKHNIDHEAGVVDIGVRVEVRNEIMEKVNNVLGIRGKVGDLLFYRRDGKDYEKRIGKRNKAECSEEQWRHRMRFRTAVK